MFHLTPVFNPSVLPQTVLLISPQSVGLLPVYHGAARDDLDVNDRRVTVAYLAGGGIMPCPLDAWKKYGSILVVFLATILAISRPTRTPKPDSNSMHGSVMLVLSPTPTAPASLFPHCWRCITPTVPRTLPAAAGPLLLLPGYIYIYTKWGKGWVI